MSAISGTYVTDDAKGLREDLTDMIYDISPEKTPFMSMIGKGKMKGTLHEWQTDALATPDTANAKAEGNDATYTVPTQTIRLGNVAQISEKTALVSGTLEAVDKAGRRSEMALQMAKRSAELKRDMESILLSNQAADSADPRKTASLLAFLKTNIDKAAGGINPVYTSLPDDVRTDGTQRAFTEAMLQAVISLAWNEGADPRFIMVGAFNKSQISGFDGNATRTLNLNGVKPGAIISSADVYVGEFGTLTVVPNRWQRTRDAFVLDPEFLSVVYLRPFNSEALAKTGDAQKRAIRVEYALKVHSEKAHGGIFDLTTS
jgi:hypothetical protein